MKPKYLYHGSTTPKIKELEPRKRFTPTELGHEAKPAIYAAKDPGYAAAHGFPWKSSEGFDVYEHKNQLTLVVPKKFKDRLDQKLFIYKLPSEKFHLLKKDTPKTLIYLTNKKAKPLGVESFKTVREALEKYNVKIVLR